jgi:hypothetical protein
VLCTITPPWPIETKRFNRWDLDQHIGLVEQMIVAICGLTTAVTIATTTGRRAD